MINAKIRCNDDRRTFRELSDDTFFILHAITSTTADGNATTLTLPRIRNAKSVGATTKRPLSILNAAHLSNTQRTDNNDVITIQSQPMPLAIRSIFVHAGAILVYGTDWIHAAFIMKLISFGNRLTPVLLTACVSLGVIVALEWVVLSPQNGAPTVIDAQPTAAADDARDVIAAEPNWQLTRRLPEALH